MNDNLNNLSPCPFCGNSAIVRHAKDFESRQKMAILCGGRWYVNEEDVIAAWENRWNWDALLTE